MAGGGVSPATLAAAGARRIRCRRRGRSRPGSDRGGGAAGAGRVAPAAPAPLMVAAARTARLLPGSIRPAPPAPSSSSSSTRVPSSTPPAPSLWAGLGPSWSEGDLPPSRVTGYPCCSSRGRSAPGPTPTPGSRLLARRPGPPPSGRGRAFPLGDAQLALLLNTRSGKGRAAAGPHACPKVARVSSARAA